MLVLNISLISIIAMIGLQQILIVSAVLLLAVFLYIRHNKKTKKSESTMQKESTTESSESMTAPIRVGTQFVQAIGNEHIHYVLSIVELYEAEGLEFSYVEPEDPASTTLNYTYTYTQGEPEPGAPIKSYQLPIFLPKIVSGTDIIPLTVTVTNSNNSHENNSGDVATSKPIIRPFMKPGTQKVSAWNDIPADELRWFVGINSVTQDNDSVIDYYYLFLIVKTNRNNEPILETGTLEQGMSCRYWPVPPEQQNDNPPPMAAVSFLEVIPSTPFTVECDWNDKGYTISFDDPEPFQFPGSLTDPIKT